MSTTTRPAVKRRPVGPCRGTHRREGGRSSTSTYGHTRVGRWRRHSLSSSATYRASLQVSGVGSRVPRQAISLSRYDAFVMMETEVQCCKLLRNDNCNSIELYFDHNTNC